MNEPSVFLTSELTLAQPEDISRIREELASGRQGILVVQTAFLGDVILITPLFRAIRRTFPAAPLTALVIPQCREIIAGLCDRVVTIDKQQGTPGAWQDVRREIAGANIGVALLPHRSFRSGRLVKASGVPVRIGFARGAGQFFHTQTVRYEYGSYEGSRNLSLLAPFSNERFDPSPKIRIASDAEEKVTTILADLKLTPANFVVMAPVSIWKTKEWPHQRYHALALKLDEMHGLTSVVVGGMSDEIACAMSALRPELNLAGKLTPMESAALMSRARMVVSGDSAAAHLATAVGAKQAIIFGSTAPRFGFAPPTANARVFGLDLWCRPCTDHGRRKCPIYRTAKCLQDIQPEAILNATSDWLKLNSNA